MWPGLLLALISMPCTAGCIVHALVHGELVSYIAGCCSFIATSCMNMADMAFSFYAEAVECMDSTSCMACWSVLNMGDIGYLVHRKLHVLICAICIGFLGGVNRLMCMWKVLWYV